LLAETSREDEEFIVRSPLMSSADPSVYEAPWRVTFLRALLPRVRDLLVPVTTSVPVAVSVAELVTFPATVSVFPPSLNVPLVWERSPFTVVFAFSANVPAPAIVRL
jgi:hypothetical protein